MGVFSLSYNDAAPQVLIGRGFSMKISINQATLSEVLSVVQKGISPRSTLPILAGIYMETKGEQVVFQSTDLELSIRYNVSALVEEPGRIVLPGKLFADIVKNLPDAAVHIQADEKGAIITCDQSSFSIKCMDPVDFPLFPSIQEEQSVQLPFEVFSSMAKKVHRVVSKDETRAILTGVLLEIEAGCVRMVATDSYRLAVAESSYEGSETDFTAVISGSFISDLASLGRTGGDIRLGLAENQIIVTYGDVTFVNRRIEGNYPNYRQLLPNTCEVKCTVKRQDLLAGIRRAALLGKNGAQIRMAIDSHSNTIQISSTAQDIGSTQETVRCEVEGPDMEIGFNSYYVSEGLSAMESADITFEAQAPVRPGIFRGTGDENYLYLVMPVKMN